MIEIEIYRAMARYNRWMNERLLEVCAPLPDEVRRRDLKAPFRSVHGTWNHLLLTDQAWLGRFQGRPTHFTSLDQEICADFEELCRERTRVDGEIEAWVETLTSEALATPFTFTPMSVPQTMTYPLYVVATHVFNHQTHHRGQITTLLEQLEIDFGVTDLLRMPGMQI